MYCDIVVVEDDLEFAESLADALRMESHQVSTFSTPEGAMEYLLDGGRATIVLLDLLTPGMSAQRFRALLLTIPTLRDLPVVILSGAPDIAKKAKTIGAIDALGKPVDLERLLATIDRHCQNRPDSKLT